MKKLIAIGEALIDFIPSEAGKGISHTEAFMPCVGGAPANVCGAFVKLGGRAEMITQLGDDPFGDKIQETFETFGIGCSYLRRTGEANTSLAFVALKEDGNREFSFYRKPGADMLYRPEYLERQWFSDCFCLHFCSVSLGDYPMMEAHKQAVRYAKESGAIISFDPNVRLPLWEDHDALRARILEFIPYADVLKISDEELEFITGETQIDQALPKLFLGDVKLVLYTEGSKGARAFTGTVSAFAPSKKVQAVDTTGAGDAFIGSFLSLLYRNGIEKDSLSALSEETLKSYLEFANTYCGKSVMKKGGLPSYPSREELL